MEMNGEDSGHFSTCTPMCGGRNTKNTGLRAARLTGLPKDSRGWSFSLRILGAVLNSCLERSLWENGDSS